MPKSGKDVTISIAPPGSCGTKSFCTPSGDQLTNTLTKTINAPGGVQGADDGSISGPVPGPVRSLSATKHVSSSYSTAFLWKPPTGNLGVQFYKLWHAHDCPTGRHVRHQKVYSPNGGESVITHIWWGGGQGRKFSVAAMGNHGIGTCKNVTASVGGF